eukprot:748080-Hanusia_phi.AAC.4
MAGERRGRCHGREEGGGRGRREEEEDEDQEPLRIKRAKFDHGEDDDEQGIALDGGSKDYAEIPELDAYDCDMIDNSRRHRLTLSDRKAAEEAMQERDERERHLKSDRGMAAGRGPVAMVQLSASRQAFAELERICSKASMDEAVCDKARELLRRSFMGFKANAKGLHGPLQACLPSVCIEIAARMIRRPVKRQVLVKSSGCKESDYVSALTLTHCMLGIRRDVTIAEL